MALLIAAALLLPAARAHAVGVAPSPLDTATNVPSAVPLVWQSNVKSALAIAAIDYEPVFVLFSSPDCQWCHRLKTQALSDPEAISLLHHFVLLEIDVTKDEKAANAYGIRGVPTVIILSADGQVRDGATGYLPLGDLRKLLKDALNPTFLKTSDASYTQLLSMIAGKTLPADKWPDVMTHLGSKEKRKELHDAIMAINPFPGKEIVGLLENPKIAVRLGAIEILEETAGDTFGYDPWFEASNAETNKVALDRWMKWAGNEATNALPVYSALTSEQSAAYIQDLLSENVERSVRASQMLRHSGPGVAEALAGFLKAHPELPPSSLKKIKEMQYSVILPAISGIEPTVLAHRLVFGTFDVKQKSIATLQTMGNKALPILRDFLDDPDGMIRESAVDAIVSTTRREALPILSEHLKKEKDLEVVYAIIRGLGNIHSRKALSILTSYLTHPNEDLVISALNSIGRLNSKAAADDIAKCLDDPRWRVRVAALEAVSKLKISTVADKVTEMLGDPDEFVRYSAVTTVTMISAKKAADNLEKAFLREDGLKGPVVAAFVSMDLPIPATFAPALKGKSPEVLLSVLEALSDSSDSTLKFAASFIDNPDYDISCAAIRQVASRGMKNAAYRAQITGILHNGKREQVLAALQYIDLSKELLAPYRTYNQEAAQGDQTTNTSFAQTADKLASIFDAFSGGSQPAPVAQTGTVKAASAPATNQPPGHAIEDVFSAFSEAPGTDATATGATANASSTAGNVEVLLHEIELKLDPANDKEVRLSAARMLARIGNPAAVPVLESALPEMTSDERHMVAYSLSGVKGTNALPLLRQLLRDPTETVREVAISACFSRAATTAFIDLLFEELLRDGSNMKPQEVYQYQLDSAVRTSSGKLAIGKWTRRILKESTNKALQNLGLVLLEKCWATGDESLIESFITSEDPYQRRAALHTLGRCEPASFLKRLSSVANDSSEYVRMVVPCIYDKTYSSRWVHYFDKDTFEPDHSYWSYSDSSSKKLPREVKDVLFTLTRDQSPKVRIEAFFSLLSNRESVDLMQFIATIDTFPDRKAVNDRVSDYMRSNYQQLGQNFSVLLPYIADDSDESETMDNIRKHFELASSAGDSTNGTAGVLVNRTEKAQTLSATFVEVPEQKEHAQALKLIYFTSPGCAECERVERLLPQVKECFQWLQIETRDIKKVASMQYNEALCERFGVPEKDRLITPVVFAGGGYLLKKDITFEGLGELLTRSAMVSTDWSAIPQEKLAAADTAITQRYSAVTPLVIIGNGLSDGINPCAFATIIFLVSYLQIARRTPKETAQVALAFIAAVFLAYFVLGLGLAEIIARLMVLKRIGLAINWAMAGLVLVLLILNLRDGVLCLQGRLNETVLQLPGFLKDRIHTTIRHGARQAKYVLAAFAMGVVISFLELACTGQVYLPTIGYMLKMKGPSTGIVWLLLLYNVAFIVPLLIIFIATYFGMTAERLTHILQKHAAAVKFATAILFLILLIMFIISSRIST